MRAWSISCASKARRVNTHFLLCSSENLRCHTMTKKNYSHVFSIATPSSIHSWAVIEGYRHMQYSLEPLTRKKYQYRRKPGNHYSIAWYHPVVLLHWWYCIHMNALASFHTLYWLAICRMVPYIQVQLAQEYNTEYTQQWQQNDTGNKCILPTTRFKTLQSLQW